MVKKVSSVSDRAVGFLYFYAVAHNTGASLRQIITHFHDVGLGKPHITKLRAQLARDRRTTKIGDDTWRLKSDCAGSLGKELCLDECFKEAPKPNLLVGNFVDKAHISALEANRTGHKYDMSRLLQMLKELDHAFGVGNYISTILLLRAILDHIPPIFGFSTFKEVTNNHGGKSFKESMLHLENSSRKIADAYLHTPIRKKESLPTKTQVNFSNDLDVLLSEILRSIDNK